MLTLGDATTILVSAPLANPENREQHIQRTAAYTITSITYAAQHPSRGRILSLDDIRPIKINAFSAMLIMHFTSLLRLSNRVKTDLVRHVIRMIECVAVMA